MTSPIPTVRVMTEASCDVIVAIVGIVATLTSMGARYIVRMG
jgi:hypothetical protein